MIAKLPRMGILPNFTRKQWLITATFIVVNFCNAMCVSMQAPFYPHEAEKKGCVPSEYGLVFGIFELTVFIVSPIIGANLNRLGVKMTLNVGIGTVGCTSIIFGLLDKIDNGKIFLGLSFTLRIIEACGNAGFLTGSFSMIAKEFPENVATMFAILETFFGLGMIMGPTVGGALYEAGGFTLPFVTLGAVLVGATIFTTIILPHSTDNSGATTNKPSMLQALKVPSIVMACYSVACSASSLGFIQATLEPHLRSFDLTALQIGAFFVISGACYGVSAPLWGLFCDKKPAKQASMVGAILMIASFLFMGPLPPFGLQKTIPVIAAALVAHGIGLGAQVVAGFADAHHQALAAGFPDTVDTYGLISGLWTSVFALGAFIGPTVAGILFDAVGFPWAALFVVVNQIVVVISLSIFFVKGRVTTQSVPKDEEESPILPTVREEPAPGYGATADAHEARTAEEARDAARSRRRQSRRSRKYSEVLSVGGSSMSVARSFSMAYPHFMGPSVASSYRNATPGGMHGASGGVPHGDMENVQEIIE